MSNDNRHKVTLISGDGIGPEVIDAAKKNIEATGVKIEWEAVPAGSQALAEYKTVLPEIVFESIKKNKVALKGPVGTPVGEGFKSVSVRIRKTLDLHANLRPIKSLSGVLLKYIGENREAKMIGQAISSVLSKGKAITIDMGGNATTTEIRDAIISEIKAKNH